jgi:hypothetical protein
MIKKLYTTITLAFMYICANAQAQAPNWAWASGAGGTGHDFCISTTTDQMGNVYATGFFTSPSITFGAITLTSGGSGNDIYIVKYDANGNVLWAKRAGGAGGDRGTGITTDASGNVYVTGYYGSLSTASSITFGTTVLSTTGSGWDMFIAKYDAAGNVLWAKDAGIGIGNDEGHSISTDASGNVYVGGFFSSDSISFGATTLVCVGNIDVFTAKYDAMGNVIWAKGAGSVGQDNITSINTDASGNTFVTGYYGYSSNNIATSITFGATTLMNLDTTSTHTDIFIVKYDASGNVVWAQGAGGTTGVYGYGITSDITGNIYVTGIFTSSVIFGNTTLTNINSSYADMFLVKLNAAGNVTWAKREGGIFGEEAYGIATDASGKVYVTGSYQGPSITFGNDTLTNSDSTGARKDLYVVKYDASGNLEWATSAAYKGYDWGTSISIDPVGNVYIGGSYQLNFGPPFYTEMAFGTDTIINAGGNGDMFIAKLGTNLVGIEENIEDREVNIYPNPSSGIFTFSIYINTVEVFNMLGELVLSQSNSNIINLQGYPKGVYVARVNGTQVCRLVKE